jgi:hypothetical protein
MSWDLLSAPLPIFRSTIRGCQPDAVTPTWLTEELAKQTPWQGWDRGSRLIAAPGACSCLIRKAVRAGTMELISASQAPYGLVL